jgi:hypothetical protein
VLCKEHGPDAQPPSGAGVGPDGRALKREGNLSKASIVKDQTGSPSGLPGISLAEPLAQFQHDLAWRHWDGRRTKKAAAAAARPTAFQIASWVLTTTIGVGRTTGTIASLGIRRRGAAGNRGNVGGLVKRAAPIRRYLTSGFFGISPFTLGGVRILIGFS